MAIWFADIPLDALNHKGAACANEHLGIELLEVGDDYLKGRMPVDRRTRQPAGELHGGASALFAETLASWAAAHVIDPARHHCVGMEISANHVRAVSEGFVFGIATPAHIGRATQVWDVRITDEHDRLVCLSRVTIAVLDIPSRD